MAKESSKDGEAVKRVTLDLPDDLYLALVARAAAEDRTIVGHVRHLLKKDTAEVVLPEEQAA